MRALIALFLFLVFASIVGPSEPLSFEQDIIDRSVCSRLPLPEQLLDRLSKVVEFALESGAAQEISQEDLYHGHLLFAPGAKDLANPMAILLHSQEMVSWADAYLKRNVMILGNGRPNVIDCSVGQSHRKYFPPAKQDFVCVVDAEDLNLDNRADVYILKAEKLPRQKLSELSKNIRIICGKKILFAGFGLTIKDGRLAVP